MAHLIDLSNHRANMAYVGETPWHGLGQELTEGAPLEVWAQEAGMSHSIERSRVAFRWGEEKGNVGVMDDKNVLWRSDTKEPLAVVSSRYQIVQPLEILEFYRNLVDSTGDYQLETAGCLNGGRKYWALAKYRESLDFAGDTIKPYLLLASSADGTMATTAQHTSVRVVCNNTLQMSLSEGGPGIIKVSHSTKFDADKIKEQLHVSQTIARYQYDVERLIDKTLDKAKAAEVFVELIAKRDEAGKITNEKAVKKIVAEIVDSLVVSPGAILQSANGTAWGAMNAVTHYVDFKARARTQDNRFSSGQFGNGADLKQRAFQALIAA